MDNLHNNFFGANIGEVYWDTYNILTNLEVNIVNVDEGTNRIPKYENIKKKFTICYDPHKHCII